MARSDLDSTYQPYQNIKKILEQIRNFRKSIRGKFGQITITIGKCPRCGKKHKDLKLIPEFEFTRPGIEPDMTVLRMRAECPKTNLFICMTFWTDVTR